MIYFLYWLYCFTALLLNGFMDLCYFLLRKKTTQHNNKAVQQYSNKTVLTLRFHIALQLFQFDEINRFIQGRNDI